MTGGIPNGIGGIPFLVIVIRKGRDPVVSLARSIAANDPMPTTPEEAMKKVVAYSGPLMEGDTVYVVPYGDVTTYRAKGRPRMVRDGV